MGISVWKLGIKGHNWVYNRSNVLNLNDFLTYMFHMKLLYL